MTRRSGKTWQYSSICLLMAATSGPNLHFCPPRLLAEEEHRQSRSHEEDRAKELPVNSAHRQRIESCATTRRNSPAPCYCETGRASCRDGQVVMPDALRGERRLHNGCGADLHQ